MYAHVYYANDFNLKYKCHHVLCHQTLDSHEEPVCTIMLLSVVTEKEQ